MPDYRRNRIPRGTYFFTVNLRDRRADHLVAYIEALRRAVRETRQRMPFHIDACGVLPDHLHCLWTPPEGDTDYPNRWRAIKTAFSQSIPAPAASTSANLRPGGRGIWQRRYWEHTIRDDRDYAAHMDDIHFNPVKHGLVRHAAAWPFSTLLGCVAKGMYPTDWSDRDVLLSGTGERSGKK